jgi:hypothetical protein
MQKVQRLERQFSMGFPLKPPGQTSTSNPFKGGAPLSPRGKQADFPVFSSTQFTKVVKPIRGGGGDVWNFQKNNKALDMTVAPNQPPSKTVPQKIDKIFNKKQGGLTSMIKSFFG